MTKTSRRSGGAPTLSDVARAAGVSPMTVSRVVNGESNIREQTRLKVNEAIAALNYAPNKAAQLLAGAVSCRIALVYGNPSNSYLSEVLVGCLEDGARSHVQLVLEKVGEAEPAQDVVRRMEAAGIDAIILPPPYCDDGKLVAALSKAGIFLASLASGEPADGVLALAIDDRCAAQEMTNYLIGMGHRRIGFIAGNTNQTASALRQKGYCEALAAAGIGQSPELIRQGDFTYRSGLAEASALLDLATPPTAIFASNDDMAAAVIAAAHRRHLEVPRDLSVCGFDDTAIATTIMPELTTVRQPISEMARTAVALLVEEIKRQPRGKGPRREASTAFQQVMPHLLVHRQSAEPPSMR